MRILDLFCGCGGASEGYRQAGLEAHREINAQKDTKANRKRKKEAEKAEQEANEAVRFAETVQQHDEYWAQFGGIV